MKITNINQLETGKTYFVLETVCENGKDTGIPKGAYTMRFVSRNMNRPGKILTSAHIKIKASNSAKECGTILVGDTTGNLIRVAGDAMVNNPYKHIFSTRKSAGDFLLSLVSQKIKGWDYYDCPEVEK